MVEIQKVIENLKKSGKSQDILYPYALGLVSAYLTDKQLKQVIKASERILAESEQK